METENRITVRYKETDRMGVVHHSNYLIYFEEGRTSFIKERGISYKEIEERGLLLPVVSVNVSYKKGATYDEVITVKTRLSALKVARCTFSYEVYSQIGELICSGSTTHAFTNPALRPVNLKKEAPDLYNILANEL